MTTHFVLVGNSPDGDTLYAMSGSRCTSPINHVLDIEAWTEYPDRLCSIESETAEDFIAWARGRGFWMINLRIETRAECYSCGSLHKVDTSCECHDNGSN